MASKTSKAKAKNPSPNSNKKSIWQLLNSLSIWVYIPILLFTFAESYPKVFDEKIDLNGDNISYYILGQALEQGEGFSNIHIADKSAHNHFPPGYPVIIATVSKLFSNDIQFIKKVNGFFLLASVVLLFLLIQKITQNNHLAFIVALFTLLNYNLLQYSVIMMSEIPFLFCSLLTLYSFMRVDFQKALTKNYLFVLSILLVAVTYYIRSTGLALFGCMVLYLLINRYWSYLATLILGFASLLLPWVLRSKSLGGNTYMKQLFKKNPYRIELGDMEIVDWFTRLWKNFERYVTREIPSGVFNYIETPNYKVDVTTNEWIIGLVIVTIMLFGLFKLKKFRLLIAFYFVCSFGILLLWPDVWYGVRFSLPLIPLFLFMFTLGVYEIFSFILSRLKVSSTSPILAYTPLILLLAAPSFTEANKKLEALSKGVYRKSYQNYFDVAKWANQNLPKEAVVSCRKIQLFHLFSGTYTTGYASTLDTEELINKLVENNEIL